MNSSSPGGPCAAVAAVHAGAAIHCWPNPSAALAEVSRVLRPGGVFVASTFLNFAAPLGQLVGDELVQPLSQVRGSRLGVGLSRCVVWFLVAGPASPCTVPHFVACPACPLPSAPVCLPGRWPLSCLPCLADSRSPACLPPAWSLPALPARSWSPTRGPTSGGRSRSCGTCVRRWAWQASAAHAPTASSSSPSPSRACRASDMGGGRACAKAQLAACAGPQTSSRPVLMAVDVCM